MRSGNKSRTIEVVCSGCHRTRHYFTALHAWPGGLKESPLFYLHAHLLIFKDTTLRRYGTLAPGGPWCGSDARTPGRPICSPWVTPGPKTNSRTTILFGVIYQQYTSKAYASGWYTRGLSEYAKPCSQAVSACTSRRSGEVDLGHQQRD